MFSSPLIFSLLLLLYSLSSSSLFLSLLLPSLQRFAKAYRSMQLESTLFGVVILQIKPQLEKLLRLPDDRYYIPFPFSFPFLLLIQSEL